MHNQRAACAMLECPFHEVHYYSLDSQSNVYGLTKFSVGHDEYKLLIGSVRGHGGKMQCFTFNKTARCCREVQFTYIPGDAEIVSIDSFNSCHPSQGIVVAIAFVKLHEGKALYYLNIYSESEAGAEQDLDRIAQGCHSQELSFLPYYLFHTQFVHNGICENVFLLSGADQKIHLFRETTTTHTFNVEPLPALFPEFTDLPGIVLWIHCSHYDEGRRRVSVVGCQNGFICVSLVDTVTKVILRKFTVQHDSAITSVQLFELHTTAPPPDFIKNAQKTNESSSLIPDYHLLVTSALEPAVVYRSVMVQGLSDALLLPDSDAYDCVLTAVIADVDFDGQNEIILGTYGQELLAYKFYNRPSRFGRCSVSNGLCADDITANTSEESSSGSGLNDGEMVQIWQRSMPDPVLAVCILDVTNDGLDELVVLTLRGLHIMQHNLEDVAKLCVQRMRDTAERSDTKSDACSEITELGTTTTTKTTSITTTTTIAEITETLHSTNVFGNN